MKANRHFAALLCLAWLASAVSAATKSAPDGASVAPPAPSAPAAAPKTDSTKASVAAKSPALVAPLSTRFQQVRDHINALFSGRIATPPPPDLNYNPFRPIGAGPAGAVRGAPGGRETTAPGPPISDLTVLQQAVATLKVRGVVEKDGRSLLTINSGPNKDGTYKEGDVITVIVQDQPIHLRVRQITHYSVMLSLNDAEYTLKF